jgi:hypothetical protein
MQMRMMMMMSNWWAVVVLLLIAGGGRMLSGGVVDAAVYYAELAPFGNYSRVEQGYVRVFTSNSRHLDIIAYYGTVRGVTPNLDRMMDCTATNACGVHIHAGFACDTSEGQGPHLYDTVKVPIDPWIIERHESSDDNGIGRYNGVVDQGTNDIDGRAFVVHNETGGRIACGILTLEDQEATDDDYYDDYYYNYDESYMCPPYSTVIRGVRTLQSFRDSCRCRDGYYRLGNTCAARECGYYQCPKNSVVRDDIVVDCLYSIRDCVCHDGYRKSGGYCVLVVATALDAAALDADAADAASSGYNGE